MIRGERGGVSYLLHVSCMLSKYKKFDDKSHREGQCSCECSDGHTGRTLCQTWLHKTDREIGVRRSLLARAPRISSQDLGLSFLLINIFSEKGEKIKWRTKRRSNWYIGSLSFVVWSISFCFIWVLDLLKLHSLPKEEEIECPFYCHISSDLI